MLCCVSSVLHKSIGNIHSCFHSTGYPFFCTVSQATRYGLCEETLPIILKVKVNQNGNNLLLRETWGGVNDTLQCHVCDGVRPPPHRVVITLFSISVSLSIMNARPCPAPLSQQSICKSHALPPAPRDRSSFYLHRSLLAARAHRALGSQAGPDGQLLGVKGGKTSG